MVKKKVQVCDRCGGGIALLKDKFVILGTYDGQKTLNETFFHYQCFKDHWEERVREQAKNMVNKMATKVVPMAKKMIGGIYGN